MKKVIITSDSTADLDYLFKEKNVPKLPLEVLLGDKIGYDGEVLPEDIFDYFAKTKQTPKTSAVSPERYEEFFKKYIAEDYEIVHFTIATGMSACYNNAVSVAKDLEGVYVIDSMNLSTGIGMQVLYALDLAKEGLSAREIYEKVSARRNKVQASFVVDTMSFLHKGGRCGGVTAFVASILKIHPSIFVRNGKMEVGKKYMGATSKSIVKYVKDILNDYPTPDKKYFFLTHSTVDPKTLEAVRAEILAVHPDVNIIQTVAGSTITAHCGKGALGILFYTDGSDGV